MTFKTQHAYVSFHFHDGIKKVYKSSLIKNFYLDIQRLTLIDDYQESLNAIEKKAILKYFLFLVSKKDYFSHELMNKALAAGFDQTNILDLVEHFKSKGFINDQNLKKKKDLLKLKKGYSLKRTSLCEDVEAQNIELEVLKKLISKKKHLLLSKDLKEASKGYRFFISRGYDITQIKQQLQDLEANLL